MPSKTKYLGKTIKNRDGTAFFISEGFIHSDYIFRLKNSASASVSFDEERIELLIASGWKIEEEPLKPFFSGSWEEIDPMLTLSEIWEYITNCKKLKIYVDLYKSKDQTYRVTSSFVTGAIYLKNDGNLRAVLEALLTLDNAIANE